MDNKFVKKTKIHFNIEEINKGLKFILSDDDMKSVLEETNQLSFCGETFSDGLFNINSETLSRNNIKKETKYTTLNHRFKNTIWEKIWNTLYNFENYKSCRMTLRKMKPKTSLIFHKDYSIRWHVVIETNPFAFMTFLDRKSNEFSSFHIPKDGYVYFTNTKFWHSAVNAGTADRYALIISTYEN
jgi:hypothetical protein